MPNSSKLSDAPAVVLGGEVEIKRVQFNLGPPKCPGRAGIVVGRNPIAGDDRGGLWYVQLHPTQRAASKVEAFWANDLVLMKPAPGTPISAPDQCAVTA